MLCSRCSTKKVAEAFYASDKTCKDCRKKMVKANRAKNVDHYRAFDRERSRNPDRVAARLAYQKTEAYRAARPDVIARYKNNHPLRRAANVAVGNAIRDGILTRLPCQVCGCKKVEAHHPDYSNFLGVVWLCVDHHAQLHAEHREHLRESEKENG